MHPFRHLILMTLLGATLVNCAPAPCLAQPPAVDPDSLHAQVRVVPEFIPLARGTTSWIAFHFEITPHWHLYWNGINDSGFPPEVRAYLPEGFVLGEPLWPVPRRLLSPGPILDHVYEESLTLLYPLTIPEDAPATVSAGFKVDWLACHEVCIPEGDSLAIDLDLSDTRGRPSDETLFRAARERLPETSGDPGFTLQVEADADTFGVRLEMNDSGAAQGRPEIAGITFFPGPDCSPPIDPGSTTQAQGRLLNLRLIGEQGTVRLAGLLQVTRRDRSTQAWKVDRLLQP